MDLKLKDQLLSFFDEYVTPHKKELIHEALENRTRHITVVLEDIFKSHNASAVLRSCECFGVQDIHIVQNEHQYTPNPYVTRGASKWLSLYNYNNVSSCISSLKQNGYRILVTVPDEKAVHYKEYDLDHKLALVFGTEFSGVSAEVMKSADDFVFIPMVGFTESLNISVSAAIILQDLMDRLRNSELAWQLSPEEKKDLTLIWYKNIVKRSDLLEERFLNENT